MTAASSPAAPPSHRFWIIPALGLAWNTFGIIQFVSASTATREHLITMGMTPEQAGVYAGLPVWMTFAFAVGAFGGLIGSALLLLRRSSAVPIFAASLAGYAVLYVGDITQGVFAAFGAQQIAILTAVVLIAAGLLWFARRARRLGHLA